MAMAKKKLMNPSHVLIFVEGDTQSPHRLLCIRQ